MYLRALFHSLWVLSAGTCLLAAPAARAQFAVIDVGAIAQLIAQAQTLEDQLTTARDHLAQAQAEFISITGGRGMERLLSGTQRNYLPASWADLQGALGSAGGLYGALSGGVAATVAANAILSPQALSLLPEDVREQIQTARRLAALQQNLTRQALANSSNRFTSLQLLIDAIPAAADQKAVLDLQARVSAENSMLQNEHSKLLTLFQLVQAEEHANRQQVLERAVMGHGQFATRFQPAP
jgi:type IV secretion system protein VirB5